MKNGTTPFDFLAGNERSRTDVPRGTGELSHGPHRRAMAGPSQAPAQAFAPGCPAEGLSPRHRQRDPLRPAQRLRLAAPAPRVPQVEDRLRQLPRLADRRHLAAGPRLAPGHAPAPRRPQDLAQRRDHRQPDGEDDRGRRPARLRHPADIQDYDGAVLVLAMLGRLKARSRRLKVIFADGVYGRSGLPEAVKQAFGWVLQTVLRPVDVKGFVVLPKRWIVERTFGWLGRYRRHSKDYERNTASSEAMIYIAASHVMLRRLARGE